MILEAKSIFLCLNIGPFLLEIHIQLLHHAIFGKISTYIFKSPSSPVQVWQPLNSYSLIEYYVYCCGWAPSLRPSDSDFGQNWKPGTREILVPLHPLLISTYPQQQHVIHYLLDSQHLKVLDNFVKIYEHVLEFLRILSAKCITQPCCIAISNQYFP
jgi:hypothetical protein